MGQTLRMASAERLTVSESQFQWKMRADALQRAAACLPAVASAKAGQPPKSKIDDWEAVVP